MRRAPSARGGVDELLARLRAIPDDTRSWDCDERAARLHYGLADEALRTLVDDGLPHVRTAEGLRFEPGDLHCLGLRLGTARPYLWVLGRWAEGLGRLAENARTDVTVEYVPQLPAGVDPTPGTARLPDGERRPVMLDNGRPAVAVSVVARGFWPALPAQAARLARQLAETIEFCPLPAPLRGDLQLVRELGLSDCATAARLLVAEWEAAGFEGRVVEGLLLSEPYSTPHCWPELRIAADWVAADPLMLAVMHRAGALEEGRWPVEQSIGPAALPLPGVAAALVAEGLDVETTFMTSLRRAQPR